MDIKRTLRLQRAFFHTGKTKDIDFRIRNLKRLEVALKKYQKEILKALQVDLGKPSFEAYMTELGLTLSELNYMKRHVRDFAKIQKKPTPLSQFYGNSYEMTEPYGVVLIMSPWNYPFLLSLEPLIGAIAAGNCCILKPSAYSASTSKLISRIIEEVFPPYYVAVVEGGRKENQLLLEEKFDYIFFTGSKSVGRMVMEKASRHLTPVTLELGGKSPCIIDETATIKLAAKRVVFGKFLNCGQTCVAVDYVLVQESVKEEFLKYCKYYIRKMYKEHPLSNPHYGHIINEKHYLRLLDLLDPDKIKLGGVGERESLKIMPTIVDGVTLDDKIMEEEIFGPILPILSYRYFHEAIEMIERNPNPLALYYFTTNDERKKIVLNQVSFGGGCINDTIIHLASSHLGFGGVGESGIGSYHGRYSFETFSHKKSIVEKANWVDLPIRYQPYRKGKEILLKLFLR